MDPTVLAAFIAGVSAIVASAVGAIVKHWLEVRSARTASTRDLKEEKPARVARESSIAPRIRRRQSRLASSLLLGLAAAGVALVFTATLVTRDPRWDNQADQFIISAALGAALTFVAWTIVGAITRCRLIPLVFAAVAGAAAITWWIIQYGDYTDTVMAAVFVGGNGGGTIGGTIGTIIRNLWR